VANKVPNSFPTTTAAYRIAFVGEAPGEQETLEGKPFVGMSGRFLRSLMSKSGIDPNACFFGNICQHRPPNNDISQFSKDGPEFRDGFHQLKLDLIAFNPNLIVLLGNTALSQFKGGKTSVDAWRGSLFEAYFHDPTKTDFEPLRFKCLSTYHPAGVLRQYSWTPLLNFDLIRARSEGTTPTLTLPKRVIETSLPLDVLVAKLRDLRANPRHIAIDIEGGVQEGVTCISFADSPTYAFVVPFYFGQWCPWTLDEEALLLKEVALTLADPNVPKILQNGLYDLFVLAYHMKILVRGFADDIMLMGWELMCEIEKGLAVQASLYTKEPYYKSERQTQDRTQFFTYNGKDSCVTYEIWQHHKSKLHDCSLAHYRFNFELLLPLLYSELRGILFDKERSVARLDKTTAEIYGVQHELNKLAGISLTIQSIFEKCRELCFVKDVKKGLVNTFADLIQHSKTSTFADVNRIVAIITAAARDQRELTPSELGEISILLKCELNVDSPPQMTEFLYRKLKLPVQYKKGKKNEDGERSETTDKLALLKLKGKHPSVQAIDLIIKLRALYTATETLGNKADPDGRIRCGYNIVGSETGRLSCYTSPSGSGFNLQTVTKKNRDIYRADGGYDLNQNDLAGADGWTVAAHCKSLGDPTMWDDYLAKLKPAQILSLMYLGYDVNRMSRDDLRVLCKQIKDGKATEINPHSWLYFACKRVQHGSNYMMREWTMSDQILQDSFKLTGEAVYVAPDICAKLQRLYLTRYPGVLQWQRVSATKLKQFRYMIVPSGHKRIFMGRPDEESTLKEWLAHEPQANTTYATNKALHRLWYDQSNRRPDGGLYIENLHQVHDALITQWPSDLRQWAVGKIREWFNNPLTIAGQSVTIPFEGAYGPSWGEQENPI